MKKKKENAYEENEKVKYNVKYRDAYIYKSPLSLRRYFSLASYLTSMLFFLDRIVQKNGGNCVVVMKTTDDGLDRFPQGPIIQFPAEAGD